MVESRAEKWFPLYWAHSKIQTRKAAPRRERFTFDDQETRSRLLVRDAADRHSVKAAGLRVHVVGGLVFPPK